MFKGKRGTRDVVNRRRGMGLILRLWKRRWGMMWRKKRGIGNVHGSCGNMWQRGSIWGNINGVEGETKDGGWGIDDVVGSGDEDDIGVEEKTEGEGNFDDEAGEMAILMIRQGRWQYWWWGWGDRWLGEMAILMVRQGKWLGEMAILMM